jgi:hypothetical protein
VKVRLTRKLADRINSVDLTDRAPGDVFQPPRHEARLLIAEGWAVPHGEDLGSPQHVAEAASATPAPVTAMDDTTLNSGSLNGVVAAALHSRHPRGSKKQRGTPT